jgi:putative CocE/NonD family hydrolase
MGMTVWQAVATAPPHLEAAFAYVTATNYHEGLTYSGGAFELGFNLWYALFLAWDTLSKLPEGKQAPARQRLIELACDLWVGYRHLPMKEIPALREVGDYYYDWLAHPSYDDYWQGLNIEERCHTINAPVLQMTGWFDNLLGGHLRSFQALKEKAATETARRHQKIIIGPWTHENYLSLTMSKVGDMELGPLAMPTAETLAFRWFDYWLKGIACIVLPVVPESET